MYTGGEGDSLEPQARYIEADVCGVKICNVYVVNGNPVQSAAFLYRERFLDRLIAHVAGLTALASYGPRPASCAHTASI